MDVVSGIASVCGILTLAVNSAKAFHDFCKEIKNAPIEISGISNDVHSLEPILSSLRSALNGVEAQRLICSRQDLREAFGQLEKPMGNCSLTLEQLMQRLQSHIVGSRGGDRRFRKSHIKWWWDKGDIKNLVSQFGQDKQTLNTGLSSITL